MVIAQLWNIQRHQPIGFAAAAALAEKKIQLLDKLVCEQLELNLTPELTFTWTISKPTNQIQ